MRVEAIQYLNTLQQAGELARRAEDDGCDTWWATEVKPDVFLACCVAAGATERIRIGTSIAVALARNPMTVAVQANDLQAYSGGRFALGLGAQIKPHITKRFSMPYSAPAARMREYILAIRAIWAAWAGDAPLDFRGEFYTHTLMTPMFDPGPNPHGNPTIHLAAVGPKMTEVAGEVADGLVAHAFGTERYLREVTLPALQRGAEKAGRDLDGFEINVPGFVVVGDSEEERAAGVEMVRRQIGFYGSTPAYRPVFELHGWEAVGVELERLSKSGGWDRMGEIIDDEVLDAFAIIGTADAVAAEVQRRYGDVCTRVGVPDDDAFARRPYAPLRAALTATAR
jgi:probable F420-dependent oxidoreductase